MKLRRIVFSDIVFVALCVFFIDCVLHISNVIFRGNAIRLMFFFILVLVSCLILLMNGFNIKKMHLGMILGVFLCLLVAYLRAVLQGQNMEIANEFIAGFTYLLFVPIMFVALKEEKDIHRFVCLVNWVGVCFSIASVLIEIVGVLNPSYVINISNFLYTYNLSPLCCTVGGTVRIIWSCIMVQVISFFISLGYYFAYEEKQKKYFLMVLINAVGIFFSYSRGVYLGTFVGFVTLMMLLKTNHMCLNRKLIRLVSIVIFVIFVVLFFLYEMGYMDIVYYSVYRLFGNDSGVTVASDMLRKEINTRLNDLCLTNPILGNGAGACIDFRDGRVEMTYKDMVSKIGVLGVFFLVVPVLDMILNFRYKNSMNEYKGYFFCVRNAIIAALIAVMVSAISNPYFVTSFGLMIYCLCIRICNYDIIEKRNCEEKTNFT